MAKTKKNIVCIGDSIVAGLGDSEGSDGWVKAVRNFLDKHHSGVFTVSNLGVSGNRTQQVTERLFEATENKPDVLVIGVGVNDTLCWDKENSAPITSEEDYRSHVTKLIREAKEVSPKTLVLIPFGIAADKVNAQSWNAALHEDLIHYYGRILIDACQTESVDYLDMYQELPKAIAPLKLKDVLYDGLHPNAKGYQAMSILVNQKLVTMGIVPELEENNALERAWKAVSLENTAQTLPEILASPGKCSELYRDLAAQGITLPKTTLTVSLGSLGSCLISPETVLKLFKKSEVPHRKEHYFDRSLEAFSKLERVADQIKQRGVDVPHLLEFGRLPDSLEIAGDEYYAWQKMPRLSGQPIGPPIQYWASDFDKAEAFEQLKKIAVAASKIHVPVQDIEFPNSTIFERFDSKKMVPGENEVIANLQNDISGIESEKKMTVLLHKDLHGSNILEGPNGKLSVIDWDEAAYGRAETDIAYTFSMLPERVPELCQIYNSGTEHMIDERLIYAHGLAGMLDVNTTLRPESTDHQRLSATRERISVLAEKMYQITGKNIYAETARDFREPSSFKREAADSYRRSL